MVNLAINHMTAANCSYAGLLSLATVCGCQGVELRGDLSAPLFDGVGGAQARAAAQQHGLQIYALAEAKAFNRFSDRTLQAATTLAALAKECGAKGIVLIPANDGSNPPPAERKSMLTTALGRLLPVLEEFDICGFVEPLGFETSTLRYKAEVVDVIESMGATSRIKLIHDTFHHQLAAEPECFAAHTALVHVSGVADSRLKFSQLQDSHRGLVDASDVLGNLQQLRRLTREDYRGPISMEAFAPDVHQLPDLADQLRDSFEFINSGLAARVA